MIDRFATPLWASEIDIVHGAGEDGYQAGYEAAKALGANELQAIAAGVLASAVEDALEEAVDAVTGN